MKFPNFTFERGRKQKKTNFSFSFKIRNQAVRIRLQENVFPLAPERTYLCGFRQRASTKLV